MVFPPYHSKMHLATWITYIFFDTATLLHALKILKVNLIVICFVRFNFGLFFGSNHTFSICFYKQYQRDNFLRMIMLCKTSRATIRDNRRRGRLWRWVLAAFSRTVLIAKYLTCSSSIPICWKNALTPCLPVAHPGDRVWGRTVHVKMSLLLVLVFWPDTNGKGCFPVQYHHAFDQLSRSPQIGVLRLSPTTSPSTMVQNS